MTDRGRTALLIAVLAVGTVETMAATCVYRDAIDAEDWEAARELVDALPEGEPVLLTERWLGPRARMEIPRLATLDVVGLPDLHGLPRFHVLGFRSRWDSTLDAELEGLPEPSATNQSSAGPLTLTTYEAPSAGTVTRSLTESGELDIETDGGPCRARGARWRCEEGTVQLQLVEIDHRPRRCLSLDVADGTHVRINANGITGERLRGHVGFHDFNGRLRNDAPLQVGILVDGEDRARFVATDEEGWRPFSVALDGGPQRVTIDAIVPVRGTWKRGSHQPNLARPPCLELRALAGGEP